MASNTSMPYSSLRPLPAGGRKPKNLGEFIARIQADRGFRNVTEASLKEEIRASENGQSEDVEMADSKTGDEDEVKDAGAARMEILRNVDIAHNSALMALDFVSLLLTKETPVQAGLTLSQQLREWVGIGTLGASKLQKSNIDEAKIKDRQDVSIGWTLLDINKTRESAAKAAAALTEEMEREGRYWDEVLAVNEKGWSVCRLPGEWHTLGVKFGFSEASPEFRNNSLAPLRRAEDGSVRLEHGRVGAGCQRLEITFERDAEASGRSLVGTSIPDSAPLQSRVLEARNTIFSQELWHELHREAHSLASYDIRATGTSISYNPNSGPRMRFELETLGETPTSSGALQDDNLAEATHLALHMLLSHAHRQNETARLRPGPPHIRRHQNLNQYHLIRPVIERFLHDQSIQQCTRFIGDLTRALRSAGIETAFFTLTNPQLSVTDLLNKSTTANRPNASQALINMLISPADFQMDVILTPEARIQIKGRTWLVPLTTTQYQVHLLEPPASTTNSLQTSCPPYKEGYPDFNSLKHYLINATTRAVTDACMAQITPDLNDKSDKIWLKSVRGTSIRDMESEASDVRFEIKELDGRPMLGVTAAWRVKNESRIQRWAWRADGTGDNINVHAIVRAVVTSQEV